MLVSVPTLLDPDFAPKAVEDQEFDHEQLSDVESVHNRFFAHNSQPRVLVVQKP